jgi:hypothetical protein
MRTAPVAYTPDPGFTGVDTFTYVATDLQALSNTATVTVTVFPVLCSTDTVSVSDEDVNGSFTRLSDPEECKRYTLTASELDGEVIFQPEGDGTVTYRGMIELGPDPAPADGIASVGLEYDPDGPEGAGGYQPLLWCENPVFDAENQVTSADIPLGETWCLASAFTRGTGLEILTTYQVYGRDDPGSPSRVETENRSAVTSGASRGARVACRPVRHSNHSEPSHGRVHLGLIVGVDAPTGRTQHTNPLGAQECRLVHQPPVGRRLESSLEATDRRLEVALASCQVGLDQGQSRQMESRRFLRADVGDDPGGRVGVPRPEMCPGQVDGDFDGGGVALHLPRLRQQLFELGDRRGNVTPIGPEARPLDQGEHGVVVVSRRHQHPDGVVDQLRGPVEMALVDEHLGTVGPGERRTGLVPAPAV